LTDEWYLCGQEVSGCPVHRPLTELCCGRGAIWPLLVSEVRGREWLTGRLAVVTETTPAVWGETLAVNLTGTFLCCRAAFSAMVPAGDGRIVTFGSLSGVYATEKFPGLSAYNVSNYGVIGLTEAVAVEGKQYGISAVCLSPGAVDTEMLRRANPALRPGLTPGGVAELVVALLDSPMASVSGANIPLFSNA
jgi:3-oxoacyl-[acyl-carrier protein] reductase